MFCIISMVMLFVYASLPKGNGVFIGDNTNIPEIAITNTRSTIGKISECKSIDLNDRDTSMAIAITAAESSLMDPFEMFTEEFLYNHAREFALWLDISIGPAQLKKERFLHYTGLNPMEFCDAIEMVRNDIKKNRSLDGSVSWPKYLRDYNGSSNNNQQGGIYTLYVFSIYDQIADPS